MAIARQGGQGQHQSGMAGLQHHGHQQTDPGKQKGSGDAWQLVLQRIESAGHDGKTGLHLIDTKEQKGHPHHHATDGLTARPGKTAQHPEHQQGQGQGAETDILPGQSQQPDSAGGAQVGTK